MMKYIKQYSLAILLFVIVLAVSISGFNIMFNRTLTHQKDQLDQAIKRGIMQCYALTGQYPESLDQLEDEYNIVYNKDLFEIKYEIVASNIMPTFVIITKG